MLLLCKDAANTTVASNRIQGMLYICLLAAKTQFVNIYNYHYTAIIIQPHAPNPLQPAPCALTVDHTSPDHTLV